MLLFPTENVRPVQVEALKHVASYIINISAWTRSYGLLTHGRFVAEIFDCPINLKLYLAEIRVIYTKKLKHNPIQMTETHF